ncbi:MAG TPA: ribbon-helix-helix protein, CopG family [Desulfobacteraceae bacterium]|nr:ribbon-helix-helix protein, CopG family [Deltaproteobacteria bacterium]MBW2356295.1 ribbon-helix-helix protein, CopG family [Deltaproteobacteria bacterium]RLB98726.1 MAG: CopG family transcriptional regulator [Deltaproteobacteria bacterium]HDI60923.1 ribbon-helix-helix protein, CopG family [Desulfobacteraceae bacterium]
MIRTQIQLTEEQVQRLKSLAGASDKSLAALIRTAVDQYLVSEKPDRHSAYRQASAIVGKHTADVEDVSENHDRYLEEAFVE